MIYTGLSVYMSAGTTDIDQMLVSQFATKVPFWLEQTKSFLGFTRRCRKQNCKGTHTTFNTSTSSTPWKRFKNLKTASEKLILIWSKIKFANIFYRGRKIKCMRNTHTVYKCTYSKRHLRVFINFKF